VEGEGDWRRALLVLCRHAARGIAHGGIRGVWGSQTGDWWWWWWLRLMVVIKGHLETETSLMA